MGEKKGHVHIKLYMLVIQYLVCICVLVGACLMYACVQCIKLCNLYTLQAPF